MNILILGGGGREHSLAWAFKQNPKCDRLVVCPGNAGISEIAQCQPLAITDGAAVRDFAKAQEIDFVVIGPEAPLVAGVADVLREAGILTFGPSAKAAQLEGSKAFTKEICAACDAPTAAYAHFTDLAEARAYVEAQGAPIVVKADGLAAGKGVTVAEDLSTALTALDALFEEPGAEVVIEALLTGEEASFFVLCDGTDALPVGTAQDHKRVGEGDTGPNTGGMGAYSPAPILSEAVQTRAMEEIVRPCLQEMAMRGTPYRGVLYVGLMIEDGAPSLVEFNVRFGDPECQILMMRLGAQVLDLLLDCAEHTLGRTPVVWADDHALTVVLAAEGYPGAVQKGSVIRGLDTLPNTSQEMCFHAGTALGEGTVLAAGGRVLNATGRGANLAEAQAKAYALVDAIDWPEGFCRRDIGWRALS
ncbi:MAG: phosphoribosylamine--glycine ligase [Pseudomonadota bacterium]